MTTTEDSGCSLENLNETMRVDCDAEFKHFLEANRLVFGSYHLVRIIVTSVIFFISLVGNTSVLLSITFRRKKKQLSHAQFIMTHLSLANLAFTCFILPMDAFWHLTLQWIAGDLLCRVMNMLKQFSMYISSAVIVVMTIDRVMNLLHPVSPGKQRKRVKFLFSFAWIFSFLNSIPGCVMFSAFRYWPMTCKCPDHSIVQCIDFNLIDVRGRRIFYFYTLCLSFFIPLLCIIACYVIIAVYIGKMNETAKATEIRSSGFRPVSRRKSLARRYLARARRMSRIVTGLITTVFVVCWGPYYVIGFIHWYEMQKDVGNKGKENRLVEAAMLMCSYLNPCLHPLITVILMKDIRKDLWRNFPCLLRPIRDVTT